MSFLKKLIPVENPDAQHMDYHNLNYHPQLHLQDQHHDTFEGSRRDDYGCTPSKLLFGKTATHWVLLIICIIANLVGGSAASLLGRSYFVHGGSHKWLYAWNQTVGWPILLLPLLFFYCTTSKYPTSFSPKLLAIYTIMGFLTAVNALLYGWGLSYLPVSTNSLACSSQLAFNAVFAYTLTQHKITPCTVNSVVLITMGAALLGFDGNSDRPAGTTHKQYMMGFIMAIIGSALYALMLTLMELMYTRVVGKTHFVLVVETQAFISAAATAFSTVYIWVAGDFNAIRKEAQEFDLGPSVYALTLIMSAVGCQIFILGSAGMIFLASSLMSCVFMTASVPVILILGVIFFNDSFSYLKTMSALLSVWGFLSYVYGSYSDAKSPLHKEEGETEVLTVKTRQEEEEEGRIGN